MPSYLSYAKHMAVFDAKDDDIQEWITVRGNHIPIKKGQSKEEAVKNFIANKSDKESSVRANKPEHIGKAANKVVKQTGENRKIYKEATSKKLSEEEKKHQEIEARWQKTLKSLEPQTAEQASLWIAETLASTEGFTSANFSKEDKEMLKKLESKFGSELAKMEEENALYEKARENVMGSVDPDPRPKNADAETVNDVLFEKYVPAQGKADTLLGEQLRAINKIVYRYENDGDMYGNGYGVETVNAPIKFLQSLYEEKSIPGLSGILSSLKNAARYNDTTEYEHNIQRLKNIMVEADWGTLKKLASVKNNEDMYSFKDDTRYDADDEEW